jgi:hypothetical protein
MAGQPEVDPRGRNALVAGGAGALGGAALWYRQGGSLPAAVLRAATASAVFAAVYTGRRLLPVRFAGLRWASLGFGGT